MTSFFPCCLNSFSASWSFFVAIKATYQLDWLSALPKRQQSEVFKLKEPYSLGDFNNVVGKTLRAARLRAGQCGYSHQFQNIYWKASHDRRRCRRFYFLPSQKQQQFCFQRYQRRSCYRVGPPSLLRPLSYMQSIHIFHLYATSYGPSIISHSSPSLEHFATGEFHDHS